MRQIQPILITIGDETTNLTTGTAKKTFRIPHNYRLTAIPRASLTTVATGATLVTIDINDDGTSILTTKLTFDASESTTTTATTPATFTAAVLADRTIIENSVITIDIDAVGNTTPGAGLKVQLLGYYLP